VKIDFVCRNDCRNQQIKFMRQDSLRITNLQRMRRFFMKILALRQNFR
jgi:hypothetical protein